MNPDLTGLPASDRVARGLDDLAREQWSVEALLLAAARSRLRELGVPVPTDGEITYPEEPELDLYATLGERVDDPYGRYNALRRELDSFIACLAARNRRADGRSA